MRLLRRNPSATMRSGLSKARGGLFNSVFTKRARGMSDKMVKALMAKNEALAKARGVSMEELEIEKARAMQIERNELIGVSEFDVINARRAHDVHKIQHDAYEKRLLADATEKIKGIISSELKSSIANILAQEIARAIGHEAISQISAEQLKQLLVQSPQLKQIIMKLKAGGRTNKREVGEAMDELKQILQQAMQ